LYRILIQQFALIINQKRERRMKRVLVALLILCAFTACSGRSTPSSTPTPSLPYAQDLRFALLKLSDLPPGWANQPSSSSSKLSPLDCGETPPDVQQVTATAEFQTDSGTPLSETIAAFHPGDAEQWLTALQAGTTCDQVSEGDIQGTPITAQITRPAYPPMGDQSFSIRATTDVASGTYVTDVIYVRVGDFIIQLGTVTVGKPDPTLTASLVQKALDALQAAKL
jgi:hypothetical protein